jgi:hypothetical protein
VVTTFVSSLDTNVAQGKGLQIQPLLTTSDKSGKATGFYILNLEQFQNMTRQGQDTMFNSKGFLVGATYTGKMKSFYAGKTPPADTTQGAGPLTVQPVNDATAESKMVVIGDGDFMNEENRPPTDNLVFFINMVEYLTDDVGLSEIRTKVSAEAPIGDISEGTQTFIKYFNLIAPSILVLLVGLFIWKRRAARRKKLEF